MKKIIAIIALTVILTSCGAMDNNQVEQNNTGDQTTKTNVQETVDNTTETNVQETVDNNTEVVELTPDEEKIIEDLLK